MAKDLPEYEQQEVVQPGTSPSGFTEAFAQVGKAYEPIAEFGLKLAQNASNQRAQQQAIEDAQTPGRKLFPSLLPTDAEYNRIYKQEEANVIQHQGNQFLRKAYEELAKNPNPTASTLLEFEQGTKSGLEDLANQADKGSRAAIKRSFQDAYNGYFYDLGHKVETSNRKFKASQIAAQQESNNELMVDANRKGRSEEATRAYNNSLLLIDIKATENGMSPEEIKREKDQAREIYNQSVGEGEYTRKTEAEKPEFIKSLRENPDKHEFLKGMNSVQQDRVIQSLQQFANKYQSAFEGQRYIDYTNAQTELAKGTLTSAKLADIEEQIGPHYSAQLRKQIAAAGAKAAETANTIAEIDKNKDNATYLADKSKEDLNAWFADKSKVFQDSQGREPTLKEQVSNIAAAIRAPIPALNDRFSKTIKNGNQKSSVEAMQAYALATPREKEALSKVDKDAAAMSYAYMSRLPGSNPETAWAKVKEMYGNISEDQREALAKDFEFATKSGGAHDISNSKSLTFETAKALKFPKTKMPVDLPLKWKKRMQDNYIIARGDWNDAERMTNEELGRGFGEHNGRIMENPPENYVKDYEFGKDFINNQILVAVKDIATKSKEFYDAHPEADFYYEFKAKPLDYKPTYMTQAQNVKFEKWIKDTEWFKEYTETYGKEPDLTSTDYDYRGAYKAGVKPIRDKLGAYYWPTRAPDGKLLANPNHPSFYEQEKESTEPNFRGLIEGKQIFRSGDIKEGYFDIDSDERTMFPEDGTNPNYLIGLFVNNIALPVRDPYNPVTVARYQPDFSQQRYDAFIAQEIERKKFVEKEEYKYRQRQLAFENKTDRDIALESIEEDISGY